MKWLRLFSVEFLAIIIVITGCARPGTNVNKSADDRYFFNRNKTVIFFASSDCFVIPLYGEVIGCEALEGVDPRSFKILGDGYSLDRNNVYYRENKISDSDPKSFKVIGDKYSLDNNNVYYKENKLSDSDPRSFNIIGHDYSLDNNNVYYKGSELPSSDSKSFTTLRDGYSSDKNAVYFQNNVLHGEDPDRFQNLDRNYAKGEKNVYWSGKRVPVEDIRSFYTVNIKDSSIFGVDGNAIYCKNKKLPFNINKFSKLELNNLYHDGVYMYNMSLCSEVDVDVPSFRIIRNKNKTDYAKDKYNVYSNRYSKLEIIDNADVDTFKVLCEKVFLYQRSPQYSKVDEYYDSYDINHLYESGLVQDGFDPKSVDISDGCQLKEISIWDLSSNVTGMSK